MPAANQDTELATLFQDVRIFELIVVIPASRQATSSIHDRRVNWGRQKHRVPSLRLRVDR